MPIELLSILGSNQGAAMGQQTTARKSITKPVLVGFEKYFEFATAKVRYQELTKKFGSKGLSIKCANPEFTLLATPDYLALLDSSTGFDSEFPPPKASPSAATSKQSTGANARARKSRPAIAPRSSSPPQIVQAIVIRPSGVKAQTASSNITPRKVFERQRLDQMVLELRNAYQQLPPDIAVSWTGNIVKRLGISFTRRIGNVVDLSIFVLEKTGELVIDFTKAVWKGQGQAHIKKKSLAGAAAGAETFEKAGHALKGVVNELRTRPADIAPELLVSALAFFVVGGGLDGDGGVPDLDIQLFGIGGHRSLFSHSIIAGTLIETSLYALVDLVTIAHKHLPPDHDPLWDSIHDRSQSLVSGATRGASAGLAYHLGVDSIVQPAAYHDLPFPAPMEVHQGISGANAASEGIEASRAKSKASPHKARSPGKPKSATSDLKEQETDATKLARLVVGGAVAIAAWLSF